MRDWEGVWTQSDLIYPKYVIFTIFTEEWMLSLMSFSSVHTNSSSTSSGRETVYIKLLPPPLGSSFIVS